MGEAAYAFELEPQYRLVDSIPEVAAARQEIRADAHNVLEHRRLNQLQGVEQEYVSVDALSTAHELLDSIKMYGLQSPQHIERSAGLVLDCQRLVAEWYRKKKPEYFPPVRHVFDSNKEEFFSHGLSIRQMTENALVPIRNNAEEESRRINERVEDATPHILRKLGKLAIGQESILTISECTDKALTDYAHDIATDSPHRGYDGYVPEIEKVMIRVIKPDSESDDRFEEQVGLPGTYITHEIIQMALAHRGVSVEHMNKTELHGSQILTTDDLMDFVALLDEVASEEWCVNIFMGEEVPKHFFKDYAHFREQALARQKSIEDEAKTVANFVVDLAEDNVDRRKAPAMVEDFVKTILLDMAKTDATVAEQMFDKKTADGLSEVRQLEAAGRFEEAFNRMQEVEKAAPGGGFCGAGQCGLESVNTQSSSGKELVKNLKADAGDKVVADKERACRCGKKSIVYAYNKNKVNKYCTSCHSFESKVSKVA